MYYYDEYTDTTQWEKPDDFSGGEEEEADEEEEDVVAGEGEKDSRSGSPDLLGLGLLEQPRPQQQGRRSSWVKSETAEGTPFYHDQETGESRWEQPAE